MNIEAAIFIYFFRLKLIIKKITVSLYQKLKMGATLKYNSKNDYNLDPQRHSKSSLRFRASLLIAVFGTLISLLSGYLAYKFLSDPFTLIAIAILVEIVILIIALGALIIEMRTEITSWLEAMITQISASNYISSTKDEIFAEKYENIMITLHDLSIGHYSLNSISEVYDDDIRSIRQLQKGDSLFSMCPVSGTASDAQKQLSNKNFMASMEAHFRAADRKVNIHRIYIFENSDTFNHEFVQSHLNEVSIVDAKTRKKSRINASYILLDDERFKDARELPRDFIIFGGQKVSVGRVSPDSHVSGGDVYADKLSINRYRMEYDRLLRMSEEFIPNEL